MFGCCAFFDILVRVCACSCPGLEIFGFVFFWASYVNLGSIVCGMCFADFADFVLHV